MPIKAPLDLQKMSQLKKTQSIEKVGMLRNHGAGIIRTGVTSDHSFIISSAIASTYCHLCEFFDETGKGFFHHCSRCKISFHTSECADKYAENEQDCLVHLSYTYAFDYYVKELLLWSNQDVLIWLFSCNLDQLRSFVVDNKFNGQDLASWKEKKNEKFSNMPPSNYLEKFSEAVERLNIKTATKTTDQNRKDSHSQKKSIHDFIMQNFHKNVQCYVCFNYLNGIQHQGTICTVCFCVTHQCCQNETNFPCKPPATKLDCVDSFFATEDLEKHIRWVKKSLTFLFKSHDKYFESFKKYPEFQKTQELKNAIIQDYRGTSIKNFNINYLSAIAHLIKDFLLAYTSEMFPNGTYRILKHMMNKKRYSDFYSTIKSLPRITQEYLNIFCDHFQKMVSKKIELIDLIGLYANYFLRPPQFDLINIKEADEANLKLFENIVTIVINDNKDDFTYENYVEDTQKLKLVTDIFLEVQPYYHDKTVKSELIKLFMDEEDGNYLCRKSKSQNSYELLVAIKGKPKLILILNEGSDYYITKDVSFYSVADIVEYYKKNHFGPSLPNIDKKLRDPIVRKTKNSLIKKLNIERLQKKLSSVKDVCERKKSQIGKINIKNEKVKKTLICVEKVKLLIKDYVEDSKPGNEEQQAQQQTQQTDINQPNFQIKLMENINKKYEMKIDEWKKMEEMISQKIKEGQSQHEKINTHVTTLEELLDLATGEKHLKGLNNLYDQIKMCFEDDKKRDPRKSSS